MTIKATSFLSLVAIWAAMIAAVAFGDAPWWTLIFAFLASGAVGVGMWRRLGVSRLIAITGTWVTTAWAVGAEPDTGWITVFAFLTTGAIVYSLMRRDAIGLGAGIAFTWLIVALVILDNEGDGAWIAVFAFLTAGSLSNSRSRHMKGLTAILWWGIAGVIMLATDGWFWLAVPAFIFTSASFGFRDFSFPRRIEWDLRERDDDGYVVK
ncbi:MAG: hypothetical protein HY875_09990 [Chloroflexi bacterium]|nr:hypothetical protein [Chloroflexota bacterium]